MREDAGAARPGTLSLVVSNEIRKGGPGRAPRVQRVRCPTPGVASVTQTFPRQLAAPTFFRRR